MNGLEAIVHLPRGIDPGFDHNVGTLLGEEADRLIATLDAADSDIRRAAIGDSWGTRLFVRHWEGRDDADWPVAAVEDAALLGALGSDSRVARFSRYTARKQREGHKDVEAGNYAIVQQAVDSGERYHSQHTPRSVVLFREVGDRWWRVVLKGTREATASTRRACTR